MTSIPSFLGGGLKVYPSAPKLCRDAGRTQIMSVQVAPDATLGIISFPLSDADKWTEFAKAACLQNTVSEVLKEQGQNTMWGAWLDFAPETSVIGRVALGRLDFAFSNHREIAGEDVASKPCYSGPNQ